MNINKRELFKDFYSKRIYFIHKRESFKEEVVRSKTLRSLLQVRCRDWEKTPLSYLSSKEALAVGIMLFVKKSYRGEKFIKKAIDFCEYAYMETQDREISYLSSMALGVLYFEYALILEEKDKQSKFFKISSAYLKTASENSSDDDHSHLYHAIVQQGRGIELELVAKTLVRASKVSIEPTPIFKLLTGIYSKLNMKEAEAFYRSKYEEEITLESWAA
ncbi:MAG: hypothetical protein ACJAT2_003669 [Bacteriovoracaceae bacterium]|jgi:hypothetical protein